MAGQEFSQKMEMERNLNKAIIDIKAPSNRMNQSSEPMQKQ